MEGCLISAEGPGMPAHFFDFLRHITEADGDADRLRQHSTRPFVQPQDAALSLGCQEVADYLVSFLLSTSSL